MTKKNKENNCVTKDTTALLQVVTQCSGNAVVKIKRI